MTCDIDQIIERLEAEIPGVRITKQRVGHPGAGEDGLWHVSVTGKVGEVQIESSLGVCPFLIESDSSDERFRGHSVDEVVLTVRRLFS